MSISSTSSKVCSADDVFSLIEVRGYISECYFSNLCDFFASAIISSLVKICGISSSESSSSS